MARKALSKEKRQSIITLRHEGQSIWKISRTFKVSLSEVAKTKRYDETGSHEDRHRKGRSRELCLEGQHPRVASLLLTLRRLILFKKQGHF